MRDKVFSFKWCLENIRRLCLKWRKRKYITSDKYHLYILLVGFIFKVTRWNIIFETLLNPQSGQLSCKFYSCTMCPASVLCPNEAQLTDSESERPIRRSSRRGKTSVVAHPHFVTWALRTNSAHKDSRQARVRGQCPEGDNSLVPMETETAS